LDAILADTSSLFQVILIDLALSADNAVAVGLAAAALPEDQRRRAVRWGIVLALILRIVFGLVTVTLLRFHGILAAGGVLLLYIALRMWNDIQHHHRQKQLPPNETPRHISFARALFSIVVANVALSLDNVLAVGGVARHTPWIMAFGLILSVLLMGVAASFIARVVDNNRWIAILGILVIVVAGGVMIWDDAHYFRPDLVPLEPPRWLGGGN
jgi:YjbE family integral membrane protein